MVVFYENPGDQLRNLALFDGFTSIDPGLGQGSAEVSLSGFLVPPGFSAKMTAFTYEGDLTISGDSFTFNGQKLSDAENPADNFFNGSRSYLGSNVSGAQDVPKLSGKAGSMAGYDLDTANVTQLVKAGDTSAKVGASSVEDIFILGGFVTSITNKAPDFPDFTKTATDLNGGALVPGDVVEFVLTAKNTGNDGAVGTVLTDKLDAGLEFVPGSIEVTSGGVTGVKTDAKDGDTADWDATSKTITVHLGTGASGTAGGTVDIGQTVTVKFKAKVVAQSGSVPNQGQIDAAGKAGGPAKSWLSDGDPLTPGQQPTTITIQECNSDKDCPANKPFCDPQTKTCKPCSTDAECTDPTKPACQPDGSCGECSKTNTTLCPTDKPVCNTFIGQCGVCMPEPDGDATKCQSDPNGPICRVSKDNTTFCGCEQDSDCGGPTSGKVCDTLGTQTCIDGCRGTDGNGCPTTLECTSKDSSIGNCVQGSGSGGTGGGTGATGGAPPATGGGGNQGASDSGDDGSCACRLLGPSSRSNGAAISLLLGLGLLALRRRAGTRVPR
jgi:fimbrial isopeptide formation D2 family protein